MLTKPNHGLHHCRDDWIFIIFYTVISLGVFLFRKADRFPVDVYISLRLFCNLFVQYVRTVYTSNMFLFYFMLVCLYSVCAAGRF
jgi:hypothetical protein